MAVTPHERWTNTSWHWKSFSTVISSYRLRSFYCSLEYINEKLEKSLVQNFIQLSFILHGKAYQKQLFVPIKSFTGKWDMKSKVIFAAASQSVENNRKYSWHFPKNIILEIERKAVLVEEKVFRQMYLWWKGLLISSVSQRLGGRRKIVMN